MKRTSVVSLLALATLALLLGTGYDLKISQVLVDKSNLVGRFGEALGEFPGYLVGAFSCAILLLTRKRASRWSVVSSLVLGGLSLALTVVFAAWLPFFYSGLPLWGSAMVGLVIVLGLVGLLRLIPRERYPEWRALGWVGAGTLAFTLVTVTLLKATWSRVRFRDLDASASAFTPWYWPQGYTGNPEWTSFPSGHVATAAVIFVVPLFASAFGANKGQLRLLKAFCLLWVFMVMVSRVLLGAHYVTDVVVGALLGSGGLWLASQLFRHPLGSTHP